jgi:pimeloyl-ACP methyl ester carboxylesterase
MLTAASYYETGVNGETHIEIYPKGWRGDGTKRGIIFSHGANGTELEARNPDGNPFNMYRFVDEIVQLGHPVLSCYLGGNHWGSPAGVSKLAAAVAYMQSTMGAKTDKVGLIGQSMGHLVSMNYTAANRAKVAFVISSMGVADLNDIYQNASYTASINAAYGGSYSNATNGPTSNPSINTSTKFAGLPWLGFAGELDTTCPLPKTQALAAGIGSTATLVEVPNGKHDWTSVGLWDISRARDFVLRNI